MIRVAILTDHAALVEAMRLVYRQERAADLEISAGLSVVMPEVFEIRALPTSPTIRIQKRERAAHLSPKSQRKGYRP